MKKSNLKLPILKVAQAPKLKRFVRYWSRLYDDVNEPLYTEAIGKAQFEVNDIAYEAQDSYNDAGIVDDVQDLFRWKNQIRLSRVKMESLNKKVKAKIGLINEMKAAPIQKRKDFEAKFREEFKDLSAVWQLFLLHMINPKEYPIYDQNVHRAYAYLHTGDFSHVNSSMRDSEKLEFYFGEYAKWTRKSGIKLKKLDMALFTFGRFLGENAAMLK